MVGSSPSALDESSIPASLARLLRSAGIPVNGDAPWAMCVHDYDVFNRILARGTLGLGEAYMDGLWDAERLDEFFHRALRADLDELLPGWARVRLAMEAIHARLRNLQSRKRAFQIGEHHYDVGNDLFEAMLDTSMSYSCAYWQHASDLEQAQRDKLAMICAKLELQPGERLLDIGCGWGSLAEHAAREHGVEVLGITVSKEQCELARQRVAGLPVQIELMDYRDLDGTFDKIVSVGMFEHVGPKNYTAYFNTVRRVMRQDGLFLLHTIGSFKAARYLDPWMQKYIFPNGKIPSPREIAGAVDGRLVIEDWHNFGPDYDRTLLAWAGNFERAWPQLKQRYDERFYRLWRYYLYSCAGFFRSRQGQLWQLILTRRDRQRTYRSKRPPDRASPPRAA